MFKPYNNNDKFISKSNRSFKNKLQKQMEFKLAANYDITTNASIKQQAFEAAQEELKIRH